ncbi:hypothetical protein ACWCP3_33040 [Streptomyces eurythermus]
MTCPDGRDPYRHGASSARSAERLRVPTALVTGWHDAPADQTFEQYGRLCRAGCGTALRVGPRTHTARDGGTGRTPVDASTFTPVRMTLHADSALTLPRGSGLV